MTVVAYRAATAAEADHRYHADALARAAQGWVPTYEHRRLLAGQAALAVTYRHDPAATAEIIEVLEALLASATRGRTSRPRGWLARGPASRRLGSAKRRG